jgi:hypothetical protein
MKPASFIASAIWAAGALTSNAAVYVSDFSALNVGDTLEGIDGWRQSEATFIEDGVSYPWAFGTEIVSNGITRTAAAVGGYYNTIPADAGGFYAARTLSLGQSLVFSMRLAINDSEAFEIDGDFFGAERNSFQVGFFDGDAEIFSLFFDPNVDPDEPNAQLNPNDSWNVSASSGGIKSSASMAVLESQLYLLNITLTPNGSNLDYFFSLASTNTLSSSGSLSGLAGASIDEMRVGIEPKNGEYGTNHIIFEGVTAAIPEPSSFLLLTLAAGGLALRRRRD